MRGGPGPPAGLARAADLDLASGLPAAGSPGLREPGLSGLADHRGGAAGLDPAGRLGAAGAAEPARDPAAAAGGHAPLVLGHLQHPHAGLGRPRARGRPQLPPGPGGAWYLPTPRTGWADLCGLPGLPPVGDGGAEFPAHGRWGCGPAGLRGLPERGPPGRRPGLHDLLSSEPDPGSPGLAGGLGPGLARSPLRLDPGGPAFGGGDTEVDPPGRRDPAFSGTRGLVPPARAGSSAGPRPRTARGGAAALLAGLPCHPGAGGPVGLVAGGRDPRHLQPLPGDGGAPAAAPVPGHPRPAGGPRVPGEAGAAAHPGPGGGPGHPCSARSA